MMAHDERGLTLVESLLSLTIILLLVGLPYSFSSLSSKALEEDLFFTRFEHKMNQMQLYSMVSNQQSYLDIHREGIRCSTSGQDNNEWDEYLEYPDTVQLVSRPVFFYFIGGTGRTSRFGSLVFQTSKGEVKIVFQISNGRYRIQRE